ncbi:MAG TPA: thermonuclease family protein [Kofleriaceae bacterium]|nr:thermonuclease family protein [Kofleriaceae bacterium]
MRRTVATSLALLAGACGGGDPACGPAHAVVESVVDGDTVHLESGETVRYLMVDTPEIGNPGDCFADEARTFNSDLVLGREVDLVYDVECEDRFDRLLAYVWVSDREVNSLLLERGYACLLHIPPNGDDRVDELQALEDEARAAGRGMWGACEVVACDQ